MNRNELLALAYDILVNAYPNRLSAREIADIITQQTGVTISPRRIRELLKNESLTNPHFAKYYVTPNRIKFSVYLYLL